MTATAGSPADGLVRDRYRVARGCLDCAGDLAGLLGALPGARQVEVLGAAAVVVIGHDGAVTPGLVAPQAVQLGLELSPAGPPAQPGAKRTSWWRSPRVLLLAAAGLLLDAGLTGGHLAGQHAVATGFYLAAVAAGGIFPVRSAWQVLSLPAAVDRHAAGGRDHRGARALMSLAPPAAALLLADGATIPVPVQDLGPDQLVRGRVIPSVQTLRLWALRTWGVL